MYQFGYLHHRRDPVFYPPLAAFPNLADRFPADPRITEKVTRFRCLDKLADPVQHLRIIAVLRALLALGLLLPPPSRRNTIQNIFAHPDHRVGKKRQLFRNEQDDSIGQAFLAIL